MRFFGRLFARTATYTFHARYIRTAWVMGWRTVRTRQVESLFRGYGACFYYADGKQGK